MLWNLLTAVLGMFIVMAGWLGIQAAVRKQSGCGPDKDMLEHMGHGCRGCAGGGSCRKGVSS